MPSDFTKHLLGLEKLEDHDLSLGFVKVDLALGNLVSVSLLISRSLGKFPSSEPSHELRVVICTLLKKNRALFLEQATQLLLDVRSCFFLFLEFELVTKFLSPIDLLFPQGELLLHGELLTLLFDIVGAVERLKLALQVLEQRFLLLLRQALVLVALFDLFLLLLDALPDLGSLIVEFLLEFLLTLEHVLVVSKAVIEFLLKGRLDGLLLQLDVSQATLLLLFLLALVLLQGLLVGKCLTINKSFIADELSP